MKITNVKATRLVFLDTIRGVASLLVVLSHVLGEFIPVLSITSYHKYVDPGLTGVAAFFLVSGFIIPFSLERIKSIKVFLINRFFRIYPLYFFIFILAIILSPLNTDTWILLQSNLLQNIFFHLFIIQDYVPKEQFGIVYLVLGSWTLLLEIIWYVIFAIIYSKKLNKKNDQLLLCANFFVIILSILAYILKLRVVMNNRPILILCSFIGLYIYRYFNKEISIKRFVPMMVLSCCTITFSLFIGFRIFKSQYFDFTSVLQSYSIAFAIFGFFYLFSEKIKGTIENALAFLGKISYSFYLGHGLVLYLVTILIGHKGWVSITIVLALSIIWAYLLFIFVETPTIAWGKKIVKKYFCIN